MSAQQFVWLSTSIGLAARFGDVDRQLDRIEQQILVESTR